MLATVVQAPATVASWISALAVRTSPLKNAILTKPTDFTEPRSNWSHCPSPLADQRVSRLLSTAFDGTLPSFALAVTPDAPGVISCACAPVASRRAAAAPHPIVVRDSKLIGLLCFLLAPFWADSRKSFRSRVDRTVHAEGCILIVFCNDLNKEDYRSLQHCQSKSRAGPAEAPGTWNRHGPGTGSCRTI